MEPHTWRVLGVIVIFVVRFGVVFCLSVVFVRFVVHVHASYTRHDAVGSFQDVVRVTTLFLQFFLFVLIERT